MPTVLRSGPSRCSFFPADAREPPHVHVRRDACTAKIWLGPVGVADSAGFSEIELRRVVQLVAAHQAHLLGAWYAFFPQ